MISLSQILEEVKNPPKALILAGAPGAGKGFILKGIDLSKYKVYNLDNEFINLLNQSNISLDLKNLDKEKRSEAAKLMAQAYNKLKNEQIPKAIENKESFILDGTASSENQTLLLKKELEEKGYKVYMLYVYADLELALKQNQDRFEKSGGKDRSLQPSIVMRTWNKVTSNYPKYREMFGSNLITVSNTGDKPSLKDLDIISSKYIKPFSHSDAVQKTDPEKLKQFYDEVKELLSSDKIQDIINSSVSREEAQKQIKSIL